MEGINIDWMEIFTLVTGIIYIVLEVRQKNLMWAVGVITSLAAMYMFWKGGLYASFGLNLYYFIISFWGLYQWRKDSAGLDAAKESHDIVHLNRLGWKTAVASAFFMLAFSAGLIWLLDILDDPMSVLDAPVAVLSAIATYWLSRSYKDQWLLWIVADLFSTVLCLTQGLYLMSALYIAYTLAAAYGYFYWSRHGRYVDSI